MKSKYLLKVKQSVLGLRDLGLLFVFTLVSIVIRGYEYGLGNQVHYLTYLNFKLQPLLYPSDYLLRTHTIPYTIFIDVVRYLPIVTGSREIPIFVLYIFLLYLFYICIFLITYTLFSDRRTSWLSLLFFVYALPIGASTIFTVEKALIPRFVADVFLLISIYFLLVKRNIEASILAAVGFLFHPLTLIPFPMIVALLVQQGYLTTRKALVGLVLFGLITFPTLGQFFISNAVQSFFLDPRWQIIVIERLPYIFVSRWPIYDLILATGIFVFFLLYPVIGRKAGKLHPIINALLVSCLALFIASIVSDYFSFRFGLQLQMGRNLFLPVVFSLIFTCRLIVSWLRNGLLRMAVCAVAVLVLVLSLLNRTGDGFLWYRQLTDFERAAVWARDNTSVDSTFLVPPDSSGFRFWSLRSVVNENKEGGDAIYDRPFGIEWDRREDLLEKYSDLTPGQVTELQNKFHMNYIVSTKSLNYRVAYSSGDWKLYQL